MKAKKPITQKRAIKAGIFGILFGFTGIHNAMLNNRKRALAHLLSSGLAILQLEPQLPLQQLHPQQPLLRQQPYQPLPLLHAQQPLQLDRKR